MVGWYPRLSLAALLAGMTLVAYGPVYQAGFVDFDDTDYLHGNAHVASGLNGENIRWAFTRYHSSNWHPLTWISHMVDVELFGLDPRGHHAMNVALHALNAALLFLLFCSLTRDAAASFAVAALFALHPINVESVAWLSQRKTTLSTLFGIGAIWCYAGYVGRRDRRAYLASLALFACSLMAKQTLVTLPFALLLLDFWPLARKELEAPATSRLGWRTLARGWRRLFPEKLPYLALVVAASVVTLLVQQQAMNTLEKYPLATRLGNVAISYVAYLEKLLWPAHLAAFYPLYNEDITAPRVAFAMLLLAAVTAACCYYGLTRRYLLVGWFWYLGTMVPVIGVVHVGAQAFADRYAYVSFWGLWMIVVWGCRDLWKRLAGFPLPRALGVGGGAGVLAVLGCLTFAQAAKWHDTITLFEDAVADTDRNWQAHRVLADHYLNRQDYERALDHCGRGLACGRQVGRLLSTQGRVLFDIGRRDDAIAALKQAIEVDPENSLAHTNLGWVYSELRQYDQAVEQLATAASLLRESNNAYARQTVYANWAHALAQSGRAAEAAETYDRALAFDPRNPLLLQGAGEAALRGGDADKAQSYLRSALEHEPGNPRSAYLLGQAYQAQGNLAAAGEAFEHVLQRMPYQPEATLKLAEVLVLQGQRAEARARLSAALAAMERHTDPNAGVARSMLLTRVADMTAADGRPAEAIRQYERALAAWSDNFQANNNLAWMLATAADAGRRDGSRAVELARRACALLQSPNPQALGTLAAAYAAGGQMDDAVKTAEQAQALARQARDERTAAALEVQLRAYRGGQPFVER